MNKLTLLVRLASAASTSFASTYAGGQLNNYSNDATDDLASGWGSVYAVVQLNNYNNDSPVYYLKPGTLAPMTMAFSITVGDQLLQDQAQNTLKFTWSEPGYFDFGAAIIPGVVGGDTVDLTFKAWNPANPTESVTKTWSQPTYDWLCCHPVAVGPNISLPTGTTIVAQVVPEPTSLALVFIGAAVLMLRHSRRVQTITTSFINEGISNSTLWAKAKIGTNVTH